MKEGATQKAKLVKVGESQARIKFALEIRPVFWGLI